jgi:hypothetical protein
VFVKAQVIGFIEKELCARLGALNGTCVQYVEAYGPVILHELGQKLVKTFLLCLDIKKILY